LVIFLIMPGFHSTIEAQDFIWEAGFHGFFDNREYGNDFEKAQTMFGARMHASLGISIYEKFCISAGLDALYEYGSSIDQGKIFPILSFQYREDPVVFLLGSFQRMQLIDMPYVLQTDTIHYYRPNIEGIFFEFRKHWGFHNIWLDWTSRQTNLNREVFVIGGTCMLKKSTFYYKHDFIMTHYANSKEALPADHIRDNGGFYTRIGVYNRNKDFLDSLSFSSGYTMSYDRLRSIYGFDFRSGSLSELYFQYRGFGMKSILYIGEGQVQMDGDALYSAKFYNRYDFFWKIFRKDLIEGKIEFSLHIIENVVDVSQMLTLYVNLNGCKKIRSGN